MHKRPISSLSLPPATLGALTRAGFENVGDLAGFEYPPFSGMMYTRFPPELRIPIAQSQLVMSASQTIAPPTAASQSLASLSKAGVAQPRTTTCKELDNLLDGGLRQGRVYELSGPPGVPKDALALKTAASYARTGEGTLFVDCQNVINTDFLEDLHGDEQELISTTAVHTLAELVLTVLTLPTLLNRLPRVLVCFFCVFAPAARTVALDRIKNALSKICATNRITVRSAT
ncbi:hypothetical protein K525DRAFT_291079 [Schizophyllum commune Loenen D]|nr:hypothetical protein K525DRAFT_291079 [Schizophyllum commune Loenen D]